MIKLYNFYINFENMYNLVFLLSYNFGKRLKSYVL